MLYYIIIIIVLLAIYASFYFIFKEEIVIHQTNMEGFDFNLLYAKQPLIIEDSIANIHHIIHLWFDSNIIDDVYPENIWNTNKHKYLLLYAGDDESEITLYHPSHKIIDGMPENDDSLMTIKLKNRKVLIIPYRWHYNIKGMVEVYGIHDYITYVLQRVIR